MPAPTDALGLNFLKQYARQNPVAGGILLGAIACFVTTALISSLGIKLNEQAIWPVVYVLAVGLPLYLLTSLLGSAIARMAGGVFVAFLLVAWVIAFIAFKYDPSNTRLGCVVYFFEPCGKTADEVTKDTANKPTLSTAGDLVADLKSPAQDAIAVSGLQDGLQVYIQFAGFQRPTIVDLAKLLSSIGWKVQGAAQGGERIASAAGLSEVRYREAKQKPAAEALARSIERSRVTNRPVRAVANGDIKPTVLEVWISQ